MKSVLATALALFVLSCNAAVAATPDLHDATATYEAFKSSQQSGYKAVDAQYRAAIAAAPQDVELAIARCLFIQNFSYAEDIDWSEAAYEELEACRGQLQQRWPDSPQARVFHLDYASGEEATVLAEKAWRESKQWPKELRARVAAHLYKSYDEEDKHKAGSYALMAAQLGNSDTLVPAIEYLAGKGQTAEAVALVRASKPATHAWVASSRIDALAKMGEPTAARNELNRSIAAGLEISAASQVQVFLADRDVKSAKKAALQLGTDTESATARFDVALASNEAAKALAMVDFNDNFETWIARYSKAVAKTPMAAFTTLLPFTLVIVLVILVFTLIPGFLLVPVHYRGLMRRVRGRAPTPMFERIGLRHAWLAGAFIIVIPALVLLAMRPDAVGEALQGLDETGSTQFSTVAIGTLLTWLALLPWQSRLRTSPVAGHRPLSLRALATVVACWGVVFAIGMISAFVYQATIGGDSSTLQTRTVQALVDNSATQYGMILTLMLIAGLVPLVEEIVFRGMLLGGMSRHISFGWANALQALLFASIHGDPPRFLVYAALGFLAGWLTRRYGSLLPAIALHALNNGMATWMHG